MPRIARIVGIGLPHHITQRGNYKQKVFLDDNDRKKYLFWIKEYSHQYDLSLLAYCLMENHVHFIAIPYREDALAKTFNTTHMRYSQYFNRRMNTKGHLWQGRFYSCVLDDKHFISAIRYVERNPVRAGLVQEACEWKWSSASFHIGKEKSEIPLGDIFEILNMSQSEWKEYLSSREEEEMIEQIRKHTLTGRPLGEISFVKELERKFGRRLRALSVGRPRKEQK